MFKGNFRTILLVIILALCPAMAGAAVSKSVSFTLSVTIPEHARIPSSAGSTSIQPVLINPAHLEFQQDIRDNQMVYLASFVVD